MTAQYCRGEKVPWLYLPLEVKARELEARVLLASVAVERGWGVLLGRGRFNLRYSGLPPGVYLDNSLPPNKREVVREHLQKGHVYTCLDEEGLVFESPAGYQRMRLDHDNIEDAARVFTWGERQWEVIRDFAPMQAPKLVITGNPRVDLLRSELSEVYTSRVVELQESYGPYLLVVSNFSAPNNANGPEFVVQQAKSYGYVATEAEEARLRERIAYQDRLLRRFLRLLPELSAACPDSTVVVRPHPGDRHSTWEEAVAPLENVVCSYEGSVIPWIMGAAALIHNNCTTAVEARLLGTPAIAYMPEVDSRFEKNLPNPVSYPAKSVHDVIFAVQSLGMVSAELAGDDERQSLLGRHVASLEGPLAAEMIVDSLRELDVSACRLPPRGMVRESRQGAFAAVLSGMRRAMAKLRASPLEAETQLQVSPEYLRQKNPGVSLQELRAFLGELKTVSGRFADVEVSTYTGEVFLFNRTTDVPSR